MELDAVLSHRTLAGSFSEITPRNCGETCPAIHLLPPPSQYIRDSPVDGMAHQRSTASSFPTHPLRSRRIARQRTRWNYWRTLGGTEFTFLFFVSLSKRLRQKFMVRRGGDRSSVLKFRPLLKIAATSNSVRASTVRYEQHTTTTTTTTTCNHVDSRWPAALLHVDPRVWIASAVYCSLRIAIMLARHLLSS